MSLVTRRLLLFLVVTAVAFAGLPTHADARLMGHDQYALQAVDEHVPGIAQHGDAECMEEVGHCSPVQLFGNQGESPEVLRREAWSVPRAVSAASLKPEASTPPPRSV